MRPQWEEEHVKEARELSVFRVLTGALGLSRGRPGCLSSVCSAQSEQVHHRSSEEVTVSAPIGSHKVTDSAEGVAEYPHSPHWGNRGSFVGFSWTLG